MNDNRRYTTNELGEHIKSIYSQIEYMARKDGVYKPLDDYFGEGTPNNRDGSYCYADKDGYHYCVTERGRLITHDVTRSLFEITYVVISNDIFWMAVKFERSHRIEGQDSRRLLFQKELQYWSAIGSEYVEQAQRKIKEWLNKAPYVD